MLFICLFVDILLEIAEWIFGNSNDKFLNCMVLFTSTTISSQHFYLVSLEIIKYWEVQVSKGKWPCS